MENRREEDLGMYEHQQRASGAREVTRIWENATKPRNSSGTRLEECGVRESLQAAYDVGGTGVRGNQGMGWDGLSANLQGQAF